jgi:Anthrax toxin LF subunit
VYRDQIAVRESGIVPDHAAAFATIAQQNDQFILFRKVEKWATGLIKENYATKDLHVKGKSSTWGPQAGFICCDQSLSKLHGGDAATVANFNHKIEESVTGGYAVKAPLVITRGRMMALATMGAIENVVQGQGGRWIVKSRQETFHLLPSSIVEVEQKAAYNRFWPVMNLWVFREVTKRGQIKDLELVTVLANPSRAPLTADYDLFAICPHLSTGGYPRTAAMRYAPPKEKWIAAVGAVQTALGQADRRKADVNLGRMSLTQRRTKDLLNAAAQAAGYTGGNVCHHGTEVDNPVTELDFPVTVFVPGPSRTIYGAQSQLELENIVRDMLRAGYVFYANRLWHTANGPITPGRTLDQSKMTQAWNTAFNVGTAMTALTDQDVV